MFLNYLLHLLVSGCSRIRLKLHRMDNDNELPCPTLRKRDYVVETCFLRYPHAIAVPYSRGGRSEAQHNQLPINRLMRPASYVLSVSS